MTICNITIQLFAEEYYRRGSARVSEGDVWVTLQLLQVSIRYAKTYGVHIQITVDQQQQLCSLHTVTRIQVAFSCSHPKERPQTLTSAPYCQSWKHCCWWQQERWDPCRTLNVSADLCSCYVTLLNMSWHKITNLSASLMFLSVQLYPFSQCEVMMVDGKGGASRTVLLSLFWALQGSLISWCYLQLKGGASTGVAMDLARDILLKCEIQWQTWMMQISLLQLPILRLRFCVYKSLYGIRFVPEETSKTS